MRKCCCCIGLRSGCITIGILFLLADALLLIWAALGLAGVMEQPLPERVVSQLSLDEQGMSIILYVVAAIGGVSCLCDIFLIYGAARDRHCSVLMWLVWTGLVLFAATAALSIVLGLSIWILVDNSAADSLGWHPQDTTSVLETFAFNEEQRRYVRNNATMSTLVASAVGLLVTSVLWGWYSSVAAYCRRLRDADVLVKSQYMHSSRL